MHHLRLSLLLLTSALLYAQGFDVVLRQGRVVDPASNTDALMDVGVRGKQIAAIAPAGTLQGKVVLDASGKVVAAGFIDLHQHGQTPENYQLKAQDGVTTALEMEVGVWPVRSWYEARRSTSLINYGASVGHIPVRMQVFHDSGTFLPKDKAVDSVATESEQRQILNDIKKGLTEGALGIGMGLAYTPGANPAELLPVFQEATAFRVPVFVHLRSAGPAKPGGLEALQEVMTYSAATGAALHVVHLSSTMIRGTPLALQLLQGAKAHGLDFTTESYPYTAGMTEIESAIFSDGWQQRNGGITYSDLQWAATGERLTAATFARYRKQGGMVAIHSIPEDTVREVMAAPDVIVASDGLLEKGVGHPRVAGTFSRVLAKYVRDQHLLTLAQALRKMSYLPAVRAGLPNKGRLMVGADADLVVFDPARVQDHATYEHPAIASEGFTHVLVNGVPVIRDGTVRNNIHPGTGVTRMP